MGCETDANDSLSPVIRGEGWGEGPVAYERRSTVVRRRPLSPALSPAYRGEGVGVIVLLALLSISVVARAAAPTSKAATTQKTQD